MSNKFLKNLQEILLKSYRPYAIFLAPTNAMTRFDSLELIDSNSSFTTIVVVPNYRIWFKLDYQYKDESAKEAKELLKASLDCQGLSVIYVTREELLTLPYLFEDAILVYRKKICLSVLLEMQYFIPIIWFLFGQLIALILFNQIGFYVIFVGLLVGFIGAISCGLIFRLRETLL